MSLTNMMVCSYIERLVRARNNVLTEFPSFESIALNIAFFIDEGCSTACANSKCVRFGPAFLNNLSDRELEFVIIHEILHVALGYPKLAYIERRAGRNLNTFNFACDIAVNSITLEIYNDDISKITLNGYGESAHTTPDGREGRCFSVDEVYEMLVSNSKQKCA